MASSVDPPAVVPEPVVPRPAAAVVPLRDGDDGLEVLVGQRTPTARFMASFWVFPGGRVEESDGPGDAGRRRAAARELHEEAGLHVEPDTLVALDRWITPKVIPIRFDTYFFVAAIVGDHTATIDGQEIVASRWASPATLFADAVEGRAVVAFPTLRQLEELSGWRSVAEATAACAARPVVPITPEIDPNDGDPVLRITAPDGSPREYRDDPGMRNEAVSLGNRARG
ncbi:MAG: NUDIX domain-containing protein [Solirubrobacteraceae bacterium]